MTLHVVQFSTGIGSAEVARRLVAEHGAGAVELLTADTLAEDADNWRFAREAAEYLGLADRWTILTDGRTPMQAGRDARVVPNNRLAVCSRVLKREIMRRHIDATYAPADTTIELGFDYTETHRLTAAAPHWTPYTIDSVLTRPPYVAKWDLLAQWRGYGIEPPALYRYGFAHANCGGACVRGGQAQWQLLLTVNRPRYLEWEADENETRELLGRDVSIMRDRAGGDTVPLTLTTFRERLEREPALFDSADWGPCGCL